MKYSLIFILLMISFNSSCSQDMPKRDKIAYRPAMLAGSWYPQNSDTLKKMLKEFLDWDKTKQVEDEIIALIAPHAGYVYSGWVAGYGYKEVMKRKYDAIIVIGPSHVKSFNGSSVFDGDAYTTPLGEAMVDKKLAKEISSVNDLVKLSQNGHEWDLPRTENSIEMQIPFIQTVQPGTTIVPICMGSQDNETTDALMKAIVTGVRKLNRKVLIVASSDLSHYHPAKEAESLDSNVVSAFGRYDYYQLALNLYSRRWEACGGAPIVAAMMAAEQLGATKAITLQYMHSGNTPNARSSSDNVVGYFTGVCVKEKGNSNILPELSAQDKNTLLTIAKNAVKDAVTKSKTKLPKNISSILKKEYASFVTLKKHGSLRGCMGHTIATNSLVDAVVETATMAAVKDPRFKAVEESELDDLEYEITILSRMQRVLNPDEVVCGRDGVYLRVGYNAGLFLPQVATEQNWDRKTFLEQLGRKAGLSTNAYLLPNAELYTFKAMIISEL